LEALNTFADVGYPIDLEIEVDLTVKNHLYMDLLLVDISMEFLNRRFKNSKTLQLEDQKITGLQNKFAFTEHYRESVDKRNTNELKIKGVMTVNLMRLVKHSGLEHANLYDHWKSFTDDDKNKFSYDLKFIVGFRDFKVDKKAFSNVSEVMKAEIEQSDESKTFVINGIKPEIFEIVLYFIHGDQMNFVMGFKNEMVFDVMKLAIKYQMQSLIDYLVSLVFAFFTEPKLVLESYTFACLYQLDELKQYCWEVIQL
jgi:hypothetical protein